MAYSLVGVDGNAYAIMGYVTKALRKSGHDDKIQPYIDDAESGDYEHLLAVSLKTITKINEEDF